MAARSRARAACSSCSKDPTYSCLPASSRMRACHLPVLRRRLTPRYCEVGSSRTDFLIRDTPVYAEVFPFLGFFAAAGLTASSSAVIVANITVFNEQSSRRTFLSFFVCLDGR